MRPDLPPELRESLAKLPPGLREAAERAADARYPTPETEAADRRERDRELMKKDAEEQRELAAKVERALGGEWGDDTRRAVHELTVDVRSSVLVLADWAKRARRHESLTPIEWATCKQAFRSTAVRYALAAAKKVIAEADRGRRGGGR